jgi:hypothetical protein
MSDLTKLENDAVGAERMRHIDATTYRMLRSAQLYTIRCERRAGLLNHAMRVCRQAELANLRDRYYS